MLKVLACIVTYNPDIDFLRKNILSLYNEVNCIVVVDNGSINSDIIFNLTNELAIKFVGLDKNMGIAQALNIGLDFASRNNFPLLLTMDQDSYFESGAITKLRNLIESEKITTALVCPIMYDIKSGFQEVQKLPFRNVTTAITSGALCRVNALVEVDGWESKLFIDGVDFDLCYKLRLRGYQLIKIKDVKLNHHLGESQKKSFLFMKFLVTNHSCFRTYYMFRNDIYLIRKYIKFIPMEMGHLVLSGLKKMVAILLFEENKIGKLKEIIRGLRDGFKMKL